MGENTKSLHSAETHLVIDPNLLKIVRRALGIFLFYVHIYSTLEHSFLPQWIHASQATAILTKF
jgi:hypothetical protein